MNIRPIKPLFNNDNYYCPKCKHLIGRLEFVAYLYDKEICHIDNYCSNCGIKIDKSEYREIGKDEH